jgi:hypothetical protein
MTEDILKDSVSEQNNVENDSNHYIEAIKEMKANTVDKEAYLKLKEENKQLLNSLVNGEEIKGQDAEQKESIEELRSKLFGTKRKDLNNLDFVENALKLRNALMESGETDPFVPTGSKIQPTDEDFAKAKKVADTLQECVDYADGDPDVFTDELKRRIN